MKNVASELDAEIIDSATDSAIICADAQGIVFRWNSGAHNIFGWSAQEMCGQPLARIFTPEDRAAGAPEQEMRMAAQSQRAPDNRWHLRKDGSRFFAMGAVTPLRGAHPGFLKVLRDASEQHDTSARLRASEQDVRTVADVLPVLIAYVDRQQRYRFVNRTYEAWFGAAPDQIVGRTLEQFLGQANYRRRAQHVQQALAGEEVRFDDAFTDRDGRRRQIHFHYVPRRGDDGTVGGFYLLGLDVSERHELQERVERDNARLQREASSNRVQLARRTEELAQRNAELAERTDDLVELARHLQTAQEDERAHLARELHDELGAIFTTAKLDLARLRPALADTDEARARMKHLADNLNRGVQLKRRIIEDLKPSALEHFGLAASLENLVADFAESSQLQVSLDLAKAQLSPTANLTVYRMVQEALTNAAKYANAKSLRIRSRHVDNALEITVSDDGVGFDPARAQRSTHGLRGMEFRLQAEGGSLAVRSAPGEGTVLTATLPLLDSAKR